jgi:tol-pal system protein YbgF
MNARIALLLCACSTACAELPPVVDKSTNPALNAAKPPATLTSDYEMMKRIEQMQAEVQQLTGKVEEQASQIEELKKQQKTMFTDFDDRIQSIENKSGTGPSAQTPADSSAGVGSTKPPLASPAASDLQISPGQVEDKQSGAVVGGPSATSQEPAQSVSPPAQVSTVEMQEYQLGYDSLRKGQTSQAITQFNTFIASHPGSAYASNAQYWLGEAHRVNQDNASARKAFNSVIETYPNSAKVPDALLKLGYIEMEEKNSTKAGEYLKRVTTEYPGSRAAGLAEKKLLMLESVP